MQLPIAPPEETVTTPHESQPETTNQPLMEQSLGVEQPAGVEHLIQQQSVMNQQQPMDNVNKISVYQCDINQEDTETFTGAFQFGLVNQYISESHAESTPNRSRPIDDITPTSSPIPSVSFYQYKSANQ